MDAHDEKRMTFGEHLEELRSCVIKSLLGVVAIAAVALTYQHELYLFFTQPYEKARVSIRERTPPTARDLVLYATVDQARRVERLEQSFARQEEKLDALAEALRGLGAELPEGTERPEGGDGGDEAGSDGADSGLFDDEHPLGWGAPSADELDALVPDLGHDIGPLKSVKVTEGFMSHIKVALLTACLVAAPWVLFQLWTFIGAGLYLHERRVVLKVLPFSIVMFGLGLTFGYLVLVPVGLDFLLSYGSPELIEPTITVSSYLGLLFVLLFVMGMVFQIPLIMTVIGGLGVIDPVVFRKKRKYFLFGGIVAAALLTPPDYITQLLVAAPIFVLYELGILLAMAAYRSKKQKQAQEASA